MSAIAKLDQLIEQVEKISVSMPLSEVQSLASSNMNSTDASWDPVCPLGYV